MMPRSSEIARSVTGAWRIFLGDPAGLAHFNLSVEGFWRSFGAIVPMAPFYLVALLVERQMRLADPAQEPFADGAFLAVRTGAILGDWVALPILLALFARQLGITQRYATFIIVRNWASLLIIVPDTAVALAFGTGALSPELAGLLSLALLAAILRYRYLIARIALGAGFGFALSLTFADLLLSLVIQAGTSRLFLD